MPGSPVSRCRLTLFVIIALSVMMTFFPRAAAAVELRLVVWEGDESLNVLRKATREFEAANPGITVKLENVDYRFYFQRLLAQIAGNTGPDVAMLDPQNFQKFAKRGVLEPLDGFIEATPSFELTDYYAPIVDIFRYQTDLYVLPRDIAPIGLIYYNKRLFKEAGLEEPDGTWTWDFKPRPELGSKCFIYCMQQLTKLGPNGKPIQWGFAPSWTGAVTDTFLLSMGARFVDDPADFTKLNFTDPRIIRAFDYVAELANKKRWMPSQTELSSVAQTTAVELFISQKVAMYQCGIWDVPNIRRSLKPGTPEFFEWDITLAPGYMDPVTKVVNRSAPTGGSGYSILKSTQHPKEAWLLLQWMAGPPGMKAMAKAGLAQPAMQSLARGPDWIPGPDTPIEQRYPPSRLVTDAAVPFVVFPPTADYWPDVSGLAFAKTEPIYSGTATAKEALTEAQRVSTGRLQTILKEGSLPKFNWQAGIAASLILLTATIAWVYLPERGKPRTQVQKLDDRASMWFLMPWILGTLLFTVGPMILSLVMSFSEWDIIQPAKYRALDNYKEALFQDPRFWNTVKVTGIYTIVSVPLGLIVALMLALLLNVKVRGMPLYRTLFYLPALASAVASSLIWRKVFQPEGGLLNMMLFGIDGNRDWFGLSSFLGLNGQLPNWLGDEKLALPSMILMSVWGVGGSMVILLAGLQAIPDFYYEAATLDGANAWDKFKVVTLPLVSPALFFSLITGMIGSFQVFTQAFVMTQGGPNDATRFYMLHLYEQSFGALRMGYASALAWILFVIVFMVTRLQWRFNRHVYYEGGP